MDRRETAGEFLARLERDEAYQATIARQDAEFAARAAELDAAERPVVDDLRAAGFDVSTA